MWIIDKFMKHDVSKIYRENYETINRLPSEFRSKYCLILFAYRMYLLNTYNIDINNPYDIVYALNGNCRPIIDELKKINKFVQGNKSGALEKGTLFLDDVACVQWIATFDGYEHEYAAIYARLMWGAIEFDSAKLEGPGSEFSFLAPRDYHLNMELLKNIWK